MRYHGAWVRKGCGGGGGEDPPVGRTNTSARLQDLRSTFDAFSPKNHAVSRKEMAKEGLAGYVVPSTDAHQVAIESIEMAMLSKLVLYMFQSEYVAPEDKRRSWLSGFTGSNG